MAQAIKQVKLGDRVKFNFNGTLEDGTVFDTTYESDVCEEDGCGCGCGGADGPMEMEVGAEQFFPEIEEALVGMSPGDRKTLTIVADDAFGEYDEEMVSVVPRDQFPADINPAVGDDFEVVNDEGESMVVTVIELDDAEVTLDANHPLAGEDLTFELELVEIL
jgi:peptidylprolyl isomerase